MPQFSCQRNVFVVLACHYPVLDGFDGPYKSSVQAVPSINSVTEPEFEPGAAGSVSFNATTVPFCSHYDFCSIIYLKTGDDPMKIF